MNKLIGDGFFRLIEVGRFRGKGGGNENQTVGNILKLDFAVSFCVLVILLEIQVNRIDKSVGDRLVGCAAELEPA